MTFSGRNLACERGGRVVFDELDYDLDAGAALMLRGPNGSGKSSLLRIAAGLLRPAAGRLSWDGAPLDRDHHRERIAWVGHLDGVKPALTTRENLRFWVRLAGAGDVEAALDAMGLRAVGDLPAAWLSAGQRRRLNLARLAAANAPLWLLDEPTVSLDDAAVARLVALLAGHLAAGGCAMIATHVDLPVAAAQLSLDDLRARP